MRAVPAAPNQEIIISIGSILMPPEMQFEILKLEYEALRKEICQSIDKQHQVLLAGYGAIAAIFGYAFARPQSTRLIALSIPGVCLAILALWTVECNRMVRASYYIGYVLWPAIRTGADRGFAGWETWIRTTRSGAHAAVFGQVQDAIQRVVTTWVPIGLSILLVLVIGIAGAVALFAAGY